MDWFSNLRHIPKQEPLPHRARLDQVAIKIGFEVLSLHKTRTDDLSASRASTQKT
jgi:hypothetical protein